jgi:hypothetical protein
MHLLLNHPVLRGIFVSVAGALATKFILSALEPPKTPPAEYGMGATEQP